MLAVCGAQAATYQYVYDPLGRLTAVIDPDNGETTDYAYDEVGNILSVTRRFVTSLTIVSFAPASGPVGTSVTIVGTAFDRTTPANNLVAFNGAAADVTSATATQIVAVVPAGATTGPITITNARGTATSATPFTVTTLGPPTISEFGPPVVAPGAAFSVSGTNFNPASGATQVRINSAAAVVQGVTPVSITAAAPTASGGRVSVSTPAGSATTPNDLFIVPPPFATSAVGATLRLVAGLQSVPFTLPAGKTVALGLVDLTAGDLVHFAVPTANFFGGYRMAVYRPDLSLYAMTDGLFGRAEGDLDIAPAPVSGTYTVLVEHTVSSGGSLGTGAAAVVRDVGGPLPNETSVDFATTLPGQYGHFFFDALAGDEPYFHFSGNTMNSPGHMVVYAPNGAQFHADVFAIADSVRQVPPLPASGRYRLKLAPPPSATVGKVTVRMRNIPKIDAGVLTPDVDKVIDFTSDLQVATATFTASAGAIVGIRASVGFTGNGSLVLIAPNGSQVEARTLAGPGLALVTWPLPASGTYLLQLKSGSSGGRVTVTLRADPLIEVGTLAIGVPASITFARDLQTARATVPCDGGFETTGFSVVNATFAGPGQLRVRRSDNSTDALEFTPPSAGLRSVISTAGTCTVYVSSGTSGGTASVVAWKDAAAGSLQLDAAPVRGTVLYPAQRARFTVQGPTPADFIAGVVNSTLPAGGSIAVTAPNGLSWANGSFTGSAGFARASPLGTGTYALTVSPSANGTGSFDVRLYQDVSATVAIDESRVIETPLPGQRARITYTATAGDQLGIDWSEVAFGSGTFHILAPGNSCCYVFNTGIPAAGMFQRMPVVPTSGTYTVNLTPETTGSARLKVWKEPAIAVSVDDAAAVTLDIPNRGQRGRFTFPGTAGTGMGIEYSAVALSGGSATYFVTLLNGPIAVFNTVIPSTGISRRFLPASTGTYIAEVTPSSNGTGSMGLRVWRDVEVAAMLDQPTPLTILRGEQQGRIRFDAAAGDHLGVQWSAVGLPGGATFLVMRPDGTPLSSSSSIPLAGTSVRQGQLAATGTYTIQLMPGASNTGSITVTPWKDAFVPLPLSTPTTITMPFVAQQGRLQYAGTTGQNLSLTLSASSTSGQLVVLDPLGSTVAGPHAFGALGLELNLPTLARDGNYIVFIARDISSPGAVTVTIAPR